MCVCVFTRTYISRFRGQHLSQEPPAGGVGVLDTDKNTWTKLLMYFSSFSRNPFLKKTAKAYRAQISLRAPAFTFLTSDFLDDIDI